MATESDIRESVRALLVATNVFDDVFMAFPDDPSGQAASDLKAAALQPATTAWETGFDADPDGAMVYRCRIPLMVLVRHDDPVQRDEMASGLLNVVRDTLDGESLGGLTLAQFTFIKHWTWQKPVPPERRITADLECRYLEEGWAAADTSEAGVVITPPGSGGSDDIITQGFG
jgi:hypothetical protein